MDSKSFLSVLLFLAVCVGAEVWAACNNDCCRAGGTCGNAAFDDCDGTWDYRTRCSPSYKTCCLPRTPVTTTTTEATTTTAYTGPPTTAPTTVPTPSPPPLPTDCGYRSARYEKSEGYIVGGQEAKPHSWPWAVSIELDYFGYGGWEHHCGGSIINNRWILTAAHCLAKSGVTDPALFRVLIGLHDQSNLAGVEIVGGEKLIWHEDYSTSTAGSPNDVALIKLSREIEFSQKVSPVCLPQTFFQDFTEMEECYIIGWGLTKGTGNEDVLNESEIDVITNEVCDYKWETGSGRVNLIKESHICAGNGVPGTCNGDSGGPLLCRVGEQWVQAGATSFGASGCTAANAPDVYTRLSMFKKWIDEKVNEN